ncbi:hypothetical protein BDN67DRAFT_965192 [Paxillus ammoniavirescens]|nr:hypothetical protein BDN67DRAFT_965192 [Paxillus ammoniavirescens]
MKSKGRRVGPLHHICAAICVVWAKITEKGCKSPMTETILEALRSPAEQLVVSCHNQAKHAVVELVNEHTNFGSTAHPKFLVCDYI